MKDKKSARIKRHFRVRKHIIGSAEKPRLAVFRSAKHVYVQAINDLEGHTVASASSLVKDLPSIEGEISGKQKVAKAVGKLIAQQLQAKGITTVVFDRGGYLYHGRVAALADGAREGGLNF